LPQFAKRQKRYQGEEHPRRIEMPAGFCTRQRGAVIRGM
jgi:hypothetical protein